MNARRVALDVLIDVLENGAYANLALKDACRDRDAQSAAFISSLVYTSLEHLYYIDHCLAAYVSRQKRVVRNILRLGATQLLYMDIPAYAAVEQTVSLAKSCGKGASSGLINAVLRRLDAERDALPPLPTEPIQRLSMQYSCPEWIVRLFMTNYGATETEELLSAKPVGMSLRAQYPNTTEQLEKALKSGYCVGKLDPDCLILEKGLDLNAFPPYKDGAATVQSEGAMYLCRACGALKGKRVLDACAAPGGKSAYLYSLAKGDIDLSCWELHEHRLKLLNSTLSRLHVQAAASQRDASIPDDAYNNAFDTVLLDVPCSGLGLLHEKPDLRYNKQAEDLASLCKLQAAILNACSAYVKIGGTLVYASCTISPDENEVQIRRFLEEKPNFQLDFERQLLPHRDGTDGFYVARMLRCR